MSKKCLYNGKVITPERIIENGYVIYENKKIIEVGRDFDASSFDGEKIDVQGKYIAPGFVDIHCHGGGGCDFMDGTLEAYKTAAETHAKHGTTALLPTTLTSTNEELLNTFEVFNKAKDMEFDGAKLIGLHLEGPYFSPLQAGAQDPRYLKSPVKEDYEEITSKSYGNIVRWSAAPELPGAAEFGSFLNEQGIVASIGHSNAQYDDVILAYENGFNLITHFYSGMSTIVREGGYRKLGVIESGYVIEGMNVEIIADGHHLPKEILKMIYKSKGAERIALVTDSMRGAGMPDGQESILGSLKDGQKVIIEGGVAKLMDRSAFAGSVCTTDRLVRTMYKLADVPLCDAVKMMTIVPARFVKIDNKKGSIALSKDADLVVFDDNINVSMTIVEGRTVYKA